MKQAIITSYGKLGVFAVNEAAVPGIQDGQVLVKTSASSVNPVDTLVRSGKLRFVSGWKTPKVIGGDFAGKVVHSKSSKWKEGDEVFGMLSPVKGGAYAGYLVAGENKLARKPAHLSLEEAGVLAIAWLTAYQALVSFGKVQGGEEVFINGCTGGVGSAAVQLAGALGARVTGTCSVPNFDFARQQGADEVYDYKQIPFAKIKNRYDLVFDASTKLSWSKMKKLGKAQAKFAITNFNPVFIPLSIFSSSMKVLNCGAVIDELPALVRLMEENGLRPHIHKEFDMADLGSAHRYFEENSVRGKVMIRMA